MLTLKLKEYPEIRALVLAAFPNYKKHAVFIREATTVTLSGTYWDSGSRSEYRAVDMVSKLSKGAPQYDPPQFGGPRVTPKVELPENVCIVEAGTFCGKPATATIFVRPENMTKFIGVSNHAQD